MDGLTFGVKLGVGVTVHTTEVGDAEVDCVILCAWVRLGNDAWLTV